jgi:hypothetical protein
MIRLPSTWWRYFCKLSSCQKLHLISSIANTSTYGVQAAVAQTQGVQASITRMNLSQILCPGTISFHSLTCPLCYLGGQEGNAQLNRPWTYAGPVERFHLPGNYPYLQLMALGARLSFTPCAFCNWNMVVFLSLESKVLRPRSSEREKLSSPNQSNSHFQNR